MHDENLFIDDQHPKSRRFAVLEDDGTSAWLYLTKPDDQTPIADIWVFNRIDAPPVSAIESYRGSPPPAAIGYTNSETALIKSPLDHEWSFLWSPDGESVAALKDDVPVAFLVSDEKQGYSRELIQDGPWGRIWSEERFQTTF